MRRLSLAFRLLEQFASTFEGHPYLHRNANLGNRIADLLYEDLNEIGTSKRLGDRIAGRSWVLNPKNISPGIKARRGDGSFGELVPGFEPVVVPGYVVARGPTANTEIGAEVKVLAKAMIKQIDRVISDLCGQASHFKHKNNSAITVGIVGINFAPAYTSFEGDRSYSTDGKHSPHPGQEAERAEVRLHLAADCFDELILLGYRASNQPPYAFAWVSEQRTRETYGAALVRIARLYDQRFS
jgi:hypothetical protein